MLPVDAAMRDGDGAGPTTKAPPCCIANKAATTRTLIVIDVVRNSRPPRRFSNVSLSQLRGAHEARSVSLLACGRPLAFALVSFIAFPERLYAPLFHEKPIPASALALCVNYFG